MYLEPYRDPYHDLRSIAYLEGIGPTSIRNLFQPMSKRDRACTNNQTCKPPDGATAKSGRGAESGVAIGRFQ